MIMRKLTMAACLLAMVAGSAQAAPNAPRRLAQFAKLPDWSGIWESENKASQGTSKAPVGYADTSLISLAAIPPYTDAWKDHIAERMKTDKTMRAPAKVCSFGFPGMMGGPHMFQMFVTPEETLIVARGDELRHVYTDRTKHPAPDDLWPTPMGDSIGRWEGQTLVIDTIARTESPLWTDTRYPISEDAHFVERITMVDADHIENRLTVSDPKALTRDLQFVFHYRRVKDLDRMFYESCTDNERNIEVDGQLIIAPPSR